jgi:hypothetical protein
LTVGDVVDPGKEAFMDGPCAEALWKINVSARTRVTRMRAIRLRSNFDLEYI